MDKAKVTVDASPADPGHSSAPKAPKINRFLLFGGGTGCLLIVCSLILVVGAAVFLYTRPFSENPTASMIPVNFTPPAEDAPTDLSEEVDEPEEAILRVEPTPTPIIVTAEIPRITFALNHNPETYKTISPGDSFPEGTEEIHAVFRYSGMVEGQNWSQIWYLEEEVRAKNSEVWNQDEAGQFALVFSEDKSEALTPGEWRLEIYVEDTLIQSGAFTVEGVPAAPTAETAVEETIEPAPLELGPFTFTADSSATEIPETESSFEAEVKQIHVIFECSGLNSEQNWQQAWYLDGEFKLTVDEQPLEEADLCHLFFGGEADQVLSPGEWKLEVYVDKVLEETGVFTIESPSPPPTPVPQANPAPDTGLRTFTLWVDAPQGSVEAGRDRWFKFTSKPDEREATLIAFVQNATQVEMRLHIGNDIPVWPHHNPELLNPTGVGTLQGNLDQNDRTQEFVWRGSIQPSTTYYIRLINRGGEPIQFCLLTRSDKSTCP